MVSEVQTKSKGLENDDAFDTSDDCHAYGDDADRRRLHFSIPICAPPHGDTYGSYDRNIIASHDRRCPFNCCKYQQSADEGEQRPIVIAFFVLIDSGDDGEFVGPNDEQADCK